MDLELKGLKAVLAGASKGIGLATAKAFAEEGCDVAICARGAQGVQNALGELSGYGVTATGDSVDVADAAAYRAWIDRASDQLGGCDIFISFASGGGGLASEETWKKTFEMDVLGTWRGIDAALPHLKASSAGSVVVISSTAAFEWFLVPQAYNAMKAAVISYASALAQQLAPQGIRVNTVSPGPVFIKEGSWDRVRRDNPDLYERIMATIPTGEMATGEEVARVIAFVASPACRAMVGTNTVVDGGFAKRVQF
jgi:3-oxoacyl-[acyl-carrier protein] reductase